MKATLSHHRTERKRVKTERESRAADAEAALDRRTETGGRIQVALSLVEDNREPERPAWRRATSRRSGCNNLKKKAGKSWRE